MSNTTKQVPSKLPNGKNNPAYMKNWRKNNPLKARENNRKVSAKWRKTPQWKEYFRNYMKEYYKKHKTLHSLHTVPANITNGVKENRKFGYEYSQIKKNLESIGWTPGTSKHINHKIPLRLLIKVNENLPKLVAFDPMILELVEKAENHSAVKREITRDTYLLAVELEGKYPDTLNGLSKEVKKHIGSML